MDFDAVERVVRRAEQLGADDAVAIGEECREWQIKFVNNEIATGMSERSEEIFVFVAKDRRIGVTTIKDVSKRNIEESVSRLLAFTRRVQPNPEYKGIAEGPFRYKVVEGIYDGRIKKLEGRAVGFVENGINAALAEGAVRASGVLKYNVKEEFLATSNNARASERSTGIYFSIRALADKDASGHKVCCSTTLSAFSPEKAGEGAGRIAKRALHPLPGSAGVYDIVFDPYPFANLLNIVMDSASILSVETGFSFFKDKLNKKVASEQVTLIDDGRLPHCLSSSKCDAEGVPTRRNIVIEKGVLKTYLHNTSTARKYGVSTTGNAGLISPKPWNAVLSKGSWREEEMFKEVERGLYITNIWYTRFQNYQRGDFSTIPRDGMFLIENGELTKSLKELRVTGNMIRMLESIEAVGRRQEQIVGWEVEIPVITPHVLVRRMRVTKPVSF